MNDEKKEMVNLPKVREKKFIQKTILPTLSLQHSFLAKWWTNILHKKNSILETKYRRRTNQRSFISTVKRFWSSLYERKKMERILQQRMGSEKTKGGGIGKERNEEGGNQGIVSQEERRIEEHKKKIELANIFLNPSFQYFIDFLVKEEENSLKELVAPILKPKDVSDDNYVWYLRGEINSFYKIRNFVQKIIEYRNKNILEKIEGRG